MLKPVDIAVLVLLASQSLPTGSTQASIAAALGIAQSNVHRALAQLERSALTTSGRPRVGAVRELLVHGVRYVYPPVFGPPVRGLATAHAGPGLSSTLIGDQTYVWPHDGGSDFGPSLEPLHPCVPGAAMRHPPFYAIMAAIDALRVGKARDREVAVRALDALLAKAQ